MLYKIIIALIFILVPYANKAQEIGDQYDNLKKYTKLKKALRIADKVFYFDISDKNLKKLPNEIESFKNLKVLNISSNNIDSLPDWIESLENLEILIYTRNELKIFPNEILLLKNLKKLYLGKNQLTEFPTTIKLLSNLELLDLTYNKIGKEHADFFKKEMPHCKVFISIVL